VLRLMPRDSDFCFEMVTQHKQSTQHTSEQMCVSFEDYLSFLGILRDQKVNGDRNLPTEETMAELQSKIGAKIALQNSELLGMGGAINRVKLRLFLLGK